MEDNLGIKVSVSFPDGTSIDDLKVIVEKIQSGEITTDNITDYLKFNLVHDEKIVL